MENETAVVRLRRKLSELSQEYSKEKSGQTRSRSATGRTVAADPNASFRYRRMRRKVDVLRTQIDSFMQDNYLTADDTDTPIKTMIPTRDTDNIPMKKKTLLNDDQNLVTVELVQVLHSKQNRIDELEQRLKDVERQESQWKLKYEQECNRCETLQTRLTELELELNNRKQQSKILGQLQLDVKRLHTAFNALEVENTQLNAQLSRIHQPTVSTKLE